MEKLRCLAVDDELPALELLEDNIQQVPFLDLVRCCRNAFEVMETLNTEKIDLIFLDIQMPGLTGLQFVNTLTTAKPMVIFVTAYDRYAIDSYNVQAIDYLVKPVAFERFVQACNRAKELFDLKNNPQFSVLNPQSSVQNTEGADHFYVNAEYSLLRIKYADILYISGLKDYVKIHLKSQNKPVLTALNLKAMEEKLTSKPFFRVHKSYIVGLNHIESIRNGYIMMGKEAIPLSESYREGFLRLIDK